MKQPIRISLGLASMLAVGLFILGTANEAQATSGGCIFAPLAVEMLLDTAPDDFVSNQGRCNSQCGAIHTACRRVALSATKCLTALMKGDRSFEKTGCSDEEDPGACKKDVKDDFSDAPAFIKEAHAFAKDECSAAKESCRDDCDFEGPS